MTEKRKEQWVWKDPEVELKRRPLLDYDHFSAPLEETDRLQLRYGICTVLGPDYEAREAARAYQNDEETEWDRRSRLGQLD